jgi:hypothetical protein
MDGNRRTGLTIILAIALLAPAGLACWKLLAKPQLGPYGAIAISDASPTYGGVWGYPDLTSAYKRPSPSARKPPAATTAW